MPTVDNKVVQMTFDNKQFERGVRESLHSLDELKKALDLDKSAESLSNLEKIASSFDISGIAKGIDSIADRFTLLGNIGQEVFHRISKTAVDVMQNAWNTVTSMPKAGMAKYEQRNKTVQMIQSALPEKSIEDIEKVLDNLVEYTDLTSYDFAAMANNMGKFVSAGIDLEVAEKVMEGIANETASAGGEISQANIAMNNFAQALSVGKVLLTDWRSIQYQNLDTKEFKEEIIKTAIEMGKLGKISDKVGYIIKGSGKNAQKVTVDYQSFANTLSAGWFTSDVMIKVFEEYADRESEVGGKGFEAAKIAITLTQSLEAVKDAISTGWANSFIYLFGNLEEAGDLFTRVSDALIDFSKEISTFRNNILKGWHDGGEDGISGYTMAIDAMSNAWRTLMGIVEAAKGAFKDVFGELDATGLIAMTQDIKDFTDRVREFFGITDEIVTHKSTSVKVLEGVAKWTGDLKRGMPKSKDVENLQKYLLNLGNDMVKLDRFGADGIFGPETEAAVKEFQKSVGLKATGIYDKQTRDALEKALYPNGTIVTETNEYTETITHLGEGAKLLQKAFKGAFSVAQAGLKVIGLGLGIAGHIVEMLFPIGEGLLNLAGGLGDVITYVVEFVSNLLSGEGAIETFNAVLSPLSTALEAVGGFLGGVGEGLSKIVEAARGVTNFEELGKLLSLDPEQNKNALAIYNVLTTIKEAAEKAKPAFDNLKKMVGGFFDAIGSWVSKNIGAGLEAISNFFTNLWDKASKGEYLSKILSGLATVLQVILGVVGGAAYGIYYLGKMIWDAVGSVIEFVKNSDVLKNVISGISKFVSPIKDFFSSVGKGFGTLFGNIGKFKSFNQLWATFLFSLSHDEIGKKFVPGLRKVKSALEAPIKGIKEFAGSVKSAFGALTKYGDPEKAMAALMKDPEKNKGAINVLTFFTKLANLFDKIRTAAGKVKSVLEGFFNKVSPALKEFGTSLWDAIKNFFGGDGTDPGEKISAGFNALKDKLQTLFEKIGNWVGNLVNNSPFLSNLVTFGKLIREAISNFFSTDTSDAATLGEKLMKRLKSFDPVIQWIKDRISEIKEIFANPESVLAYVKGFFVNVGNVIGEIFKNINLGTLWNAAKVAFAGYIMYSIASAMKNFSKSVGVLTGAVRQKGDFAQSFLKIAASIAIIAAALAALAFIPADKALAGVGVMTLAIAVVTGAIILLNKFAPKTEGLGKGILFMALSIGAVLLALAGAVALLTGPHAKDIPEALKFCGEIFAVLLAAGIIMSRFGKKGGGSKGGALTILAMCAGLSLVVSAIGKMTRLLENHLDRQVEKSLLLVGGILVALGAIAVLMSAFSKGDKKSAGSSGIASTIVAISYAIGNIVGAVREMLGIVHEADSTELSDAYWMVEGLLITIGGIAVLLAKSQKTTGIFASIASVAPILAMGWMIDTIINTLATAIQSISGVDPAIVESFMDGAWKAIAAAGATIAGVVWIVSKISGAEAALGTMIKLSIGLIAVMSAIGIGVDIAATFISDGVESMGEALTLVGWSMEMFSDSMSKINIPVIQSALKCMTDSVLPAIRQFVQNRTTVDTGLAVARQVWRFGEAIALFETSIRGITVNTGTAIKQFASDTKEAVNTLNSIEGIDSAKSMLEGVGAAIGLYYGNLKSAAANISGQEEIASDDFDVNLANDAFQKLADLTLTDETLAKIKSYSKEGGDKLNGFAEGIQNLSVALQNYGDNISTLKPKKIRLANKVLDKVSGLNTTLPAVSEVPFDALTPYRSKITDFGLDVAELGTALSKYGESISGLNPGKVFLASSVITLVANMTKELPTTGGLWGMIVGEKKLGGFAANLGYLGSGMAKYANAVSAANFDNVGDSAGIVKALAEAQSILQKEGGMEKLLAGSANLGNLGIGLVDLGDELYKFATSTGGATEGIKALTDTDFEQIAKGIEPIKALAEAQSILQKEGGLAEKFEGSSNLGNLGEGLKSFGLDLVEFSGTIKNFDAEEPHLVAALGMLERIATMQAIVQNGDATYDFNNLGVGFNNLLAWLSETITSDEESKLSEKTSKGIQAMLAGMATAISSDTTTVEAMGTLLGNVKTEIDEYGKDDGPFYKAGQNIDAGMQKGIENNESKKLVAVAATAVAMEAYEAAVKALGIASPSKLFAWLGEMTDAGFAEGLKDHTKQVGTASSNMAKIAENTVRDILGIHSHSRTFIDIGSDAVGGFVEGVTKKFSDVKDAFTNMATTAFTSGKEGSDNFLQTALNMLLGDNASLEIPITPVFDMSNADSAQAYISNLLGGQNIGGSVDLAGSISNGKGVTIIQGGTTEDHSKEILEGIEGLSKDIAAMTNTIRNLRVVMDTNALVGQLAGPIDRRLGQYASR